MSVIYAIKNYIRLGRTGVTVHEIQVREAESEEVKAMDLLLHTETKVPSNYVLRESPKQRQFMENRMHNIPAYSIKVIAVGSYTGSNRSEIVWDD